MSEIFVSPDELTLEAPEGATLLDVAVEAGIPIAHLCGGRARCSTCRV
ncbi:adenylate/guanylate cyclase domain-containing protein, partial [Enterococcus hirae]